MKENTINALSANVEKGATGIHYFNGNETMEITTADKTLMTKIRRLAKVSDDVVIDQEPNKDNVGFMLALVPAKCTQCGGQIKVDDSKEAGICKHCGMPFITEKAIK